MSKAGADKLGSSDCIESLPCNSEQIRQTAARIVNSRTFERCDQLKTILVSLCNAVAEGRTAEITETMIGERILNRKDFDPATDTIVRVQMRRLRSKLEEYYRLEGLTDPVRVEIPKYAYAPIFRESAPSPSLPAEAQPSEPVQPKSYKFWRPVAAAFVIVLAFVGGLLCERSLRKSSPAVDRTVAESPFWRGFVHAQQQPILAISTPLFFRSRESYIRDFRLNFQEDLVHAPSLLGDQMAWPCWNTFASIADIKSVLLWARLVSASGYPVVVRSGRELTPAELQGNPILFLGHPRGSPPLMDLLADLPLYIRRSATAQPVRGIFNRSPRSGEQAEYINTGETDLEVLSENRPDYVLVTYLRRPRGADVLSVFGNRYESSGLVLELLADPSQLKPLQDRLRAESGNAWATHGMQVLFKVNFLNGKAMDARYVTHRKLQPSS